MKAILFSTLIFIFSITFISATLQIANTPTEKAINLVPPKVPSNISYIVSNNSLYWDGHSFVIGAVSSIETDPLSIHKDGSSTTSEIIPFTKGIRILTNNWIWLGADTLGGYEIGKASDNVTYINGFYRNKMIPFVIQGMTADPDTTLTGANVSIFAGAGSEGDIQSAGNGGDLVLKGGNGGTESLFDTSSDGGNIFISGGNKYGGGVNGKVYLNDVYNLCNTTNSCFTLSELNATSTSTTTYYSDEKYINKNSSNAFILNETKLNLTINNFGINVGFNSTYNSTYATWAYNQTFNSTGYAQYQFINNNFNGSGNITAGGGTFIGKVGADKKLYSPNARIGTDDNAFSGRLILEYNSSVLDTVWQIDNGGNSIRFFNDTTVIARINQTGLYEGTSRVCTATNGVCQSAGDGTGGWINTSTETNTTLNVNVKNNLTFDKIANANIYVIAGNGSNLTISSGNSQTGSNKVGGNLIFSGGSATGNRGSSIVFQTAVRASSGSAVRTPTATWTIDTLGNLVSGTDGTGLYTITTGDFINGAGFEASAPAGGSPEFDYLIGGVRRMVFGYDDAKARGIFYSDVLLGGMFFYDSGGITIGQIGGDTYNTSGTLNLPYNGGNWGQANINGSLNVSGIITTQNASAWTNYAVCYLAGGKLGHCTSIIGATGTCSCAAN